MAIERVEAVQMLELLHQRLLDLIFDKVGHSQSIRFVLNSVQSDQNNWGYHA
jgi:hypothetical protein